MSRRYSDLNDLIHDLDEEEAHSDNPFGIAEFDDEDLAILGGFSPDGPRPLPAKKPAPAKPKRGRPRKTS
ncbi:hypothetical protein MARCHEWKA_00900 [Brevundimonas phage vB_BpoS-Marchewka]|uniref:Uncharacterized protein n=1 Tax=Brevundimonas phage vB_BpoS-Marchewka TaxID=2948604 RepID=A0A9E7N4E3_9CAUD|nr:hypothetical protein MARCHEWKA_00900 [Brevundimonas phage vB_BpoS-Marchewka]